MDFTTVLLALTSGLVGALISSIIYVRREKRMFKVATLKKFAAHRYHITGDGFSQALNEIFVVFNDSKEVMSALEEFHKVVTGRQGTAASNDGLVKLYKAMCKDAKIKFEHFNDSFFLSPFNIKND